MTRTYKIVLLSIGALIPIVLFAFPTGAPPRMTGAPGDLNCITSGCHTGTVFPNSSAINLKFPNGATYTPGVKQTLTVTASDSFALRYGFELTARLSSDQTNGQAGDLAPADTTLAHTECDGTGSAPPCDPTAPVQFVTHSTPSTAGAWQVNWTPPATNAGNVVFYLAVNASANSGPTNKHIHLQSFTVTPQASTPLTCPSTSSTPFICGVTNGASFQAKAAPGSYITISGAGLSTNTAGRLWTSSDFSNGGLGLPVTMDNTSVTINGKTAYLEFISPAQLNAITPVDSSAAGQQVPVVVTLNGQASPSFNVQLNALLPAFFTEFPGDSDDGKYVVAQHAVGFGRVGKAGLYPSQPNLTTPAKAGETVVLYGTGFGPTTPAAPDGAFVSQVSPLNTQPTVTVGGVQATVAFGGLVPPFAALYQFNIALPSNLPSGDAPLIATLPNGVVTQSELITIQ